MSNEWMQPKNVLRIDLLLPLYKDIPEDFKLERGDARKWTKIVNEWFFNGMRSVRVIVKRKEIDQVVAMRHLKEIMNSWEPQHEHKIAGVAYLMSLWFDDIMYERRHNDD
jgi:hypothetical protein